MISVLLSNWTYQEFMSFNVSYQKGEVQLAFELASKVITDWEYDAPISDTSILDLNPIESAKVMRAIVGKMEEFTEGINPDLVAVDLSLWSTKKFISFNEALVGHQFIKVERMMHVIASIEGVDPEDTLSATQGMMLQFAISRTYQRVMQGKN